MHFERTPDDRFQNLKDYAFTPHYLQVDDTEGGTLRLHYLDEGPADGPVVLLMHGQPVWSYLYRYMIPLLVDRGFRVIAPDLIGFGRSDKPTQRQDYTYARHVTWMSDWLTQLDLQDITVFFQDWGSLIGLRLVTAFPERFGRVVLANGALPAGMIPQEFAEPLAEAYKAMPLVSASELEARFRDTSGMPGILYWRKFCAESSELQCSVVVQNSSVRELSEGECAAYDAPFPTEAFMQGARQFPSLIPLFPDEPEVAENKAAWDVLREFQKPFLLAFSDDDPVTAGGDAHFIEHVPGAKGLPHRTIENAGHFLQQDSPEACVQAIVDVMECG
ncbi:MAG: haloalkane dehalogenase [Halioglobus sp.]